MVSIILKHKNMNNRNLTYNSKYFSLYMRMSWGPISCTASAWTLAIVDIPIVGIGVGHVIVVVAVMHTCQWQREHIFTVVFN